MLHTSFLARANDENIEGLWLDQDLVMRTDSHINPKGWNYVVVEDIVAGLEKDDRVFVKFTRINNRQEMFEYMNKPEYQEYLKKPAKVLDYHWMNTEYKPTDWWWLASPYLSASPSCLEAGKTKWSDMRSIYAEIITYPCDFGYKKVHITVDPWNKEFVMVW